MIEIRELKESELDSILKLYSHLHDSDEPLPDRQTIEVVWREIQNSSYFQYFGVFVEKNLVSSCTLSVIPNLTRGCNPYGVIENVVTHKNYRSKGYGSRVLRYALEQAWSRNCYKVMLLTGRKEEAVSRFYESVGFDRGVKQAFLAKPE